MPTEYLKVKAANNTKELYIKLNPIPNQPDHYLVEIVYVPTPQQPAGTFDFQTVNNPASGDKVFDTNDQNINPPLTVEHMNGNGDVPVKWRII